MVCSTAVLDGSALLVRDPQLFRRYYLAVTSVAADFEADRARLLRILDFLDEELADREHFRTLTRGQYRAERDVRRNVDRWVEMLVNAAIDIGKIVLSASGRPVPRTYGQILSDLESVPAFSSLAGQLAPLAPLRNLLAHEYLDLRFGRIRRFVDEGATAVEELSALTRSWLEPDSEAGS